MGPLRYYCHFYCHIMIYYDFFTGHLQSLPVYLYMARTLAQNLGCDLYGISTACQAKSPSDNNEAVANTGCYSTCGLVAALLGKKRSLLMKWMKCWTDRAASRRSCQRTLLFSPCVYWQPWCKRAGQSNLKTAMTVQKRPERKSLGPSGLPGGLSKNSQEICWDFHKVCMDTCLESLRRFGCVLHLLLLNSVCVSGR